MRPRLAGVVSFGEQGYPVPLGQVDFFDSHNARQLRRLHPGPETVVMVPGHAHGVDLLDDTRQVRVRAAVDRFLERVLD